MEVSVVIPVYNEALYLDRCIQSVLNQSEVAEIILVDDHSTDKSMEICRRWERENEKIRVFTNTGIKGAGGAINTGLYQTTYVYIAILGADDYFLQDRFKYDEALFKAHPDIDAIAHSIKVVTSDHQTYSALQTHFEDKQRIGWEPSFEVIDIFQTGNLKKHFSIIGMTIKKSVFDTIGYFDESLKQAQDSDLILRMLIRCKVLTGDYQRPVAVYYRHAHNTTRNFTEAVYYRRLKAKKHFHLSVSHRMPKERIVKCFKDFLEYDYLWITRGNWPWKKVGKIFLLLWMILRLISTTNPTYDPSRKIMVR